MQGSTTSAGSHRRRAISRSGENPRSEHWIGGRRGLIGAFAVTVALSLAIGGLAGAVGRQVTSSVDAAAAALTTAETAYADATAEVDTAGERYRTVAAAAVQLEEDLRRLDRSSLDTVLAYEETMRRARELAVDAYVRGGTQSNLESYLDAEAVTDVVLRLHLMIGRVDRAQEAASELRTQRILVDAEAKAVAADVATLGAQLDDAADGLDRARRQQEAAYESLLAATDRLSSAEQAEAEARRAADAAAAAEAGRAAVRSRPTTTTAPAPAVDEVSEDDDSSGGAASPFVPPTTDDDGQAEAWEKLRQCESGGNYQAVSAGGYYRGAYQFAWSTWEGVGGVGDPAAASPAEQDYRARLLYERSGRGQWPVCGRYLR